MICSSASMSPDKIPFFAVMYFSRSPLSIRSFSSFSIKTRIGLAGAAACWRTLHQLDKLLFGKVVEVDISAHHVFPSSDPVGRVSHREMTLATFSPENRSYGLQSTFNSDPRSAPHCQSGKPIAAFNALETVVPLAAHGQSTRTQRVALSSRLNASLMSQVPAAGLHAATDCASAHTTTSPPISPPLMVLPLTPTIIP